MKPRWRFACGWIGAALLLTITLPLSALTGPELTVQGPRGERAQLIIANIEADVFFHQDLAETVLTITFRNPEARVTEGEFAMPLPPGSTVSSYALDVNGKMRESVAVEKERARNAYESIKRQMIDPGFVEREAGNVYRTKIFPIPSQGTKAVRIGYCEILPTKDGRIHYHLPLTEGVKTSGVEVSIQDFENRPLTLTSEGGLKFDQRDQSHLRATGNQITLGKEIALTFDAPPGASISTAGNYSYLRSPLPDDFQNSRPRTPKTLEIIWDCSESARSRDHQKELALLEAYFTEVPDIEVTLTLQHLTSEQGGVYNIKNGQWHKLREALSRVLYDGSTNISATKPKADLTLLFSDGRDSFPPSVKWWSHPCILIDSLGTALPHWSQLATQSGGESINLKSTPLPQSLRQLTHSTPTIFAREYLRLENDIVRLFQQKHVPNSLRYQSGEGKETKISIPVTRITNSRVESLLRSIWAQQKLQKLEAAALPNSREIIAHCKEHNLVSDETSLIVLDRFQDYLRYRIPPPEDDLRKKYEEQIKTLQKDQAKPLRRAWSSRTWWHGRNFPWQDHLFIPSVQKISIWEKSLAQAFKKDDLDQEAVGTIVRWKEHALQLMKQRPALSKDAEYRAWLQKLTALKEQEDQLGNTLPKPGPNDNKIAVSLRGFVENPGTFKVKSGETLAKALAKAGGIQELGTASGVALYRNAHKTIYNTLSTQYEDVALLPGDMVVVLQKNWDYRWASSGDSDPFGGAADSAPVDPASLPAIIAAPTTSPSFGSNDPFGGTLPVQRKEGTLILAETANIESARLQEFRKKLTTGADPLETYSQLRKAPRYHDRFYLEASYTLREQGYEQLANRALSNLVEESQPRAASYRKWAFALARIGDQAQASQVLDKIAVLYPDDQLIALDQAWLAQQTSPALAVPLWVKAAGAYSERVFLADVAAAYLNVARNGPAAFPAINLHRKLPADLRIVITNTSGSSAGYRIKDPAGSHNPSNLSWDRISPTGGRLSEGKGLGEYQIKNAIPGSYELSVVNSEDDLYRIEIYRNWGRPTQTSETRFLHLHGKKERQTILTYAFKFAE
ncbi:VIT domain-containing protein [Verrucomicrobiaceae bacterium 227]